jgi:hypothetical protein
MTTKPISDYRLSCILDQTEQETLTADLRERDARKDGLESVDDVLLIGFGAALGAALCVTYNPAYVVALSVLGAVGYLVYRVWSRTTPAPPTPGGKPRASRRPLGPSSATSC